VEIREKPLRIKVRMLYSTTEVMSVDPSCTVLSVVQMIGKRLGLRGNYGENYGLFIERLQAGDTPMSGWLNSTAQLNTYEITEAVCTGDVIGFSQERSL
jgi:hypothetical protein